MNLTSRALGNARGSSCSARRHRVLWDSDNAYREGKTSINILLEWLLAPGNYERWRDGKLQTGETREALCSEIKSVMQQHGIHHRENANIRTQISELERSFSAARNWLKENNYDPYTFKRMTDDEEILEPNNSRESAEAHVKRMCRYYHALNEIFGQDEDKGIRHRRINLRPGLNSMLTQKHKVGDEEDEVRRFKVHTEIVGDDEQRVERNGVDSILRSVSSTAAPIANASASNVVSGTTSNGAIPATGLTRTWANPATLESTRHVLAEAVREERERKRFCMEEERNKLECEKLRYEVEAAKLQLTIDRALARKKLTDAGLSESQVNELFPK